MEQKQHYANIQDAQQSLASFNTVAKWFKIYLCYVYDCLACMYVYGHHVHAWGLWMSEVGIRSPVTGVINVVSHHVGARN